MKRLLVCLSVLIPTLLVAASSSSSSDDPIGRRRAEKSSGRCKGGSAISSREAQLRKLQEFDPDWTGRYKALQLPSLTSTDGGWLPEEMDEVCGRVPIDSPRERVKIAAVAQKLVREQKKSLPEPREGAGGSPRVGRLKDDAQDGRRTPSPRDLAALQAESGEDKDSPRRFSPRTLALLVDATTVKIDALSVSTQRTQRSVSDPCLSGRE